MAQTTHDDRRRYSRVNFDTMATLIQGQQQWQATVLDISLNGVLLETPANFSFDDKLSAEIVLQLAEDAVIRMQVKLVHRRDSVLGFECESIDMDSIVHVRRLVELNLNDPMASERILYELLKHPEL